MTEETKTEEFVAKDFVHCGLRFGNGEMFVALCPIGEDGTIEEEANYNFNKKRDRAIGLVYTGAIFSKDSVKGLDAATYKDRFNDQEKIIGWRALSDDARVKEKQFKMLKDEKKMNQFDEILLPLRKAYTAARKRNDFATLEAMEKAVVRSLTTPVRKGEIDA